MAISFHPTHPLTDGELQQLSRANPGMRFERGARGELIVPPPVGTIGGYGEAELSFQLESWARRDKSGLAFAPDTGFTLPDSSVLAPDAAWISRERWNALSDAQRKGYAHIAPDVVFELLSPGDMLDEARVKAAAYVANGVRLVVLLDPRSRSVECRRPDGLVASYDAGIGSVSLEPDLPGFFLDAQAVFARVAGEMD